MLEKLTSLIPLETFRRSGEVFYSGRSAFSKPSSLYLMGYNPGTDPEEMPHDTVEKNVFDMINSKSDRFSSYTDESWNDRPPGSAPMQRRIVHMLRTVGLEPHDVPASNLLFVRSRSEKEIHREARHLEEICWPFHQRVIDVLKIRIIVCLGKSTAKAVRKRLSADRYIDSFIENNNRGYKSDAYANDTGIIVIRVTQPGRFNWINPRSDPSPLVQSMLDMKNTV